MTTPTDQATPNTTSPTGPSTASTMADTLSQGAGPLLDRAKAFAKAKPAATAALAGVLGIALLNTLRGRR